MIGSTQTIAASNVVKPTWKDCAVWIDANDYAVGTFANGAVITNKGNNGATFDVSGATLEVQLDANGRKEFEFNGSYIRCTGGSSAMTQYHHTNSGILYQIYFIGKFGTTSNPDAVYGVCGDNGTSSSNIGIAIFIDNRVATAAADRGVRYLVTNGTVSAPVYASNFNNGTYNTEQSTWVTMVGAAIMDQSYCIKDGSIVAVVDVQRSTATTTSGLGTARNSNSAASSQTFNIGAVGNGTLANATGTTMKQFIIFDQLLSLTDSRGVDAYFGLYPTRGVTTIRAGGGTVRLLQDEYVLGGTYVKNADRSKTVLVTSKGPNHFTAGSDRDGVQLVSTDDGKAWALPYTSIFTDATNAYHNPAGGYSPAGTLVVLVSKYNATTGTYASLVAVRSTDDGTTWGSEIPITLPVTSPTLTAWVPHDSLVTCNNGDIAITLYALSGTSLYKIYSVRSADDGLTWSFDQIYTSGSVAINESSIGWLGGDNWIVWSRVEAVSGAVFVYKQFRSSDDLVTFSDQGNTTFGGALYAHPPMLRSFLIDGTRVVEASWINRLTRRWHMKYATATELAAGTVTVWAGKTTYTVFERLQGSTTGWITGYPFFIHSRDDLNMEGVWFEEISSSVTRTGFQYFNDELKAAIKTELGI